MDKKFNLGINNIRAKDLQNKNNQEVYIQQSSTGDTDEKKKNSSNAKNSNNKNEIKNIKLKKDQNLKIITSNVYIISEKKEDEKKKKKTVNNKKTKNKNIVQKKECNIKNPNEIMNYYNNKNPSYINNNIINNLLLSDFIQKIQLFEKYRQLGFYYMQNPQNINHYLLLNSFNNNYNCFNNMNNLNLFNNYMNYNNYNGYQNPLLSNYLQNPNFMNLNLNPTNIFGNKHNLNNKDTNFYKKNKKKKLVNNKKEISSQTENKKNESNNNEKKEKNYINIDSIINGKETRTVVRLNPVPPKLSCFDLTKLFDKMLNIENGKNQRIYKALYTPLCKVIGKNLGYCFIMMVKPKYVFDFYSKFNGIILKKCKKPCEVIWADIQGNDFLNMNNDDPLRKPIIFNDIIQD